MPGITFTESAPNHLGLEIVRCVRLLELEERSRIDKSNDQLDMLFAEPATGSPQPEFALSQVKKILRILKKKGTISLWDTFFKPDNGINCLRLTSRITDLKKLGVTFEEDAHGHAPMVRLPNGKMVAEYRLKYWSGIDSRHRKGF